MVDAWFGIRRQKCVQRAPAELGASKDTRPERGPVRLRNCLAIWVPDLTGRLHLALATRRGG